MFRTPWTQDRPVDRTPRDRSRRPARRRRINRAWIVEALEGRTLLNAGDLDPTFGAGGKVTTEFPGFQSALALGIVVQSNGKVVAAGYSDQGSVGRDFALACYNADGSLDTSFGSGGKVITSFGPYDSTADSVAVQADGKIVVAGGYGSVDSAFALARYNANGFLDTSFGSGGKVITDFGPDTDGATSVAIQSDGKIVAAGESYQDRGASFDFALARYNANGSLDTTFGSGGKVTTGFGAYIDQATSVAIQSDGKIVAAGRSYRLSGNDCL